jgi:putative ABC transport system permease protein
MSTLLYDLRFAVRTLRRAPGFTAIAVLTLALGIGATSIMFSWMLVIVTAANPAPDMDRLAGVWSYNRTQGEPKNVVSPHDFVEWRRRQRSFERFSAFRSGAVNLSGTDQPVRASALFVTADFFDVLNRTPVVGRGFRAEEERPGAPPVVVLSDRFWRERFDGRADVLGRTVSIDGRNATIVGVLPRDDFSEQVLLPLTIDPASPAHSERALFVFTRLRHGVSLEQARVDMAAIGSQLERELPDTHRGWGVNTTPLSEEFMGPQARLVFGLLIGAAAAVLLIGCANIANLLLARGISRTREFAIRTALGGSRLRLVRQMLVESFLLAIAGGLAGILVAHWGTALLRASFDAGAAYMERVSLNGAVLAFAASAALFSTLVFGLLPAWQSSRPAVNENLREGSRSTGGIRTARMRASLVAAEVALAVLFLVVSVLTMRTLAAIQRIEPGFDTTNLLTMRVSLPEARYGTDAAVTAFFTQAVERLRTSRGVVAAGAAVRMPATGSRWNPNRSLVIEGRPAPSGETRFAADLTVTPGYLETLRFPVRAGRTFSESDGVEAPLVVVVSDTAVRRYFDGNPRQALGTRVRLGDEPAPETWRTIVGIVGDVRNDDIDSPPLPMVYVPLAQRASREMTIVMRTAGDPMGYVDEARAAITAIDPMQPVYEVKSMAQILVEDLRQSVVLIGIIGIFALVALALAALGIYGVVAHAVAQRTHEIGVRMALGAAVADVIALVVRQGLAPVATGLAIGMAAGVAISQAMRSVLYGVTPGDPITYATAAIVLTAVALLACVAPARRATRVDPLVAIRSE